ncbi:thioredoxin family protein [Heyndrickxia sporothermodurans]|nr:thioredoxin family protein [Heyndrickxia sporothermodurans]
MEVVFYTRDQCMLCKEAKQLLTLLKEEHDFQLLEININESDELTEAYGLMIPVIEVEKEIIQYGQIDYFSLNHYLQQKNKSS